MKVCILLLAILAVVAAACGDDSTSTETTGAANTVVATSSGGAVQLEQGIPDGAESVALADVPADIQQRFEIDSLPDGAQVYLVKGQASDVYLLARPDTVTVAASDDCASIKALPESDTWGIRCPARSPHAG